MNIFIYGNASFKSDINKVFEHSNIKFRLSNNDSIQEIKTLIELRTAIENNPKDIYLIDDAKIFRKNALNKKIKFLRPKDSIEEEFIKSHDIDDLSIDSLDDLPKYIIKKLEEVNAIDAEDDYHNSNEKSDIHNSIIDIVDDAYNTEDVDYNTTVGDFDEENDKIQLDDELSSLLIGEEDSESECNIDNKDKIETEDDLLLQEDEVLIEERIEIQIDKNDDGGEDMPDEFSELDNINESDILAALDGLEDVDVNSIMPAKMEADTNDSAVSQSNMGVEVGGSNVNEIAALITSLLNNKTLEITIKVKA